MQLLKANKDKTLDRLSRLEGQVRGIVGMVKADRYCMDILAQTSAIRSAILGVEKLILEKRLLRSLKHSPIASQTNA